MKTTNYMDVERENYRKTGKIVPMHKNSKVNYIKIMMIKTVSDDFKNINKINV